MEFKAFVVKGDANHSDLHMQMRKSLANVEAATQTTECKAQWGLLGTLGQATITIFRKTFKLKKN